MMKRHASCCRGARAFVLLICAIMGGSVVEGHSVPYGVPSLPAPVGKCRIVEVTTYANQR